MWCMGRRVRAHLGVLRWQWLQEEGGLWQRRKHLQQLAGSVLPARSLLHRRRWRKLLLLLLLPGATRLHRGTLRSSPLRLRLRLVLLCWLLLLVAICLLLWLLLLLRRLLLLLPVIALLLLRQLLVVALLRQLLRWRL